MNNSTKALNEISSTSFQVHKSFQNNDNKNVLDYSEYRLRRYLVSITDQQQKKVVSELLSDYKKGLVAVAWRKGFPRHNKIINAK